MGVLLGIGLMFSSFVYLIFIFKNRKTKDNFWAFRGYLSGILLFLGGLIKTLKDVGLI